MSHATFSDLVAEFGSAARQNLSGPGEREALLSRPVGNFIERFGSLKKLNVTAHDEVAEQDGTVRPDFGVRVNQVLTGHIELKAPGISLDPESYSPNTHNGKQWARLSKLPNLLHTNGKEWRLWRYGELVHEPVHVHAQNISSFKGRLTAPDRFELILQDFLAWEPVAITSISRLVDTIAPLALMLREEVKLAILAEKRSVKAGAPRETQPFLGVARDWRKLLFPGATDEEFADGFAQTVVFSLVIALSDGISLEGSSLPRIAKELETHYGILGRSLDLLTEHIENTPTSAAVEIIVRTLSKTNWQQISTGGKDVYLHLYEHFLSSYDPEKRKKSGSYYTPVEVVDFMVRISDDTVKQYLNKPSGLRDPSVSIIDPAMGTGTYPLSVLRHVAESAKQEYGPGAASEAVANAADRIYGIELQSGPFSVAELRVSQAIKDAGAKVSPNGLNLYVADTLEDPYSASEQQLSYTLQLIAQQRIKANLIKRERNIQVVIGNPPYKDKSKGLGGWIENGTDPNTNESPLAAFFTPQNANHNQHLRNLYVFFWRWATHKVFESTADPNVKDGDSGLICFITASGYLAGPGFKGMRKYLRRNCSHGWIINVSPEGKQPPQKNAVFNIETPVVIGLFVRNSENDSNVPAVIKYREVHGTKEEKFDALLKIDLDDEGWSTTRNDWQSPFTPDTGKSWDEMPAINQLFPWVGPGIKANRKWIYAPSTDVLEQRVRELVAETDWESKVQKFQESFHATLGKSKQPLPGRDTEQDTHIPFKDVAWIEEPKIVPVGYRSFDRQYIVADSRLIHSPSNPLWAGRVRGQIFGVEQHAHHPKKGPGMMYSALIPDMDFFRGSEGGRAVPYLHPDQSLNVADGLEQGLHALLSPEAKIEDLFFYVAGIVAHPGFVKHYDDELRTPGIRVPVTTELELWTEAVRLGKHVVWLHTFGEQGERPRGKADVLSKEQGDRFPTYMESVKRMPDKVEYDAVSETLNVGGGIWTDVSKRVREYTVGGMNVIDSWVGYRQAVPKGRKTQKSSQLEQFVQTQWPGEWSIEFSRILAILTSLVELETDQENLLERVTLSNVISNKDFSEAGVRWPENAKDRRPRMPLVSDFFE